MAMTALDPARLADVEAARRSFHEVMPQSSITPHQHALMWGAHLLAVIAQLQDNRDAWTLLATQAQEQVSRLQAERDKLVKAIAHSSEVIDWSIDAIASLASAQAEDSDLVDAAEAARDEAQRAEAAMREALVAAQQFIYPEISRGPAINGWQNTVDIVEAALAPASTGATTP